MRLPILVAAALATALLSGCAGEDPAADPAAPGPDVVTDPRDYSYLQDAAPGSHVHDYWQGRDTVRVIEARGSTNFQLAAAGNGGVSA